jgi:hypothetical protein
MLQTESFPEINATEICLLEWQDTVDFDVCGAASNCQNCTATLYSDDVAPCLRYEKADSNIEPHCGPSNSNTDANNCDINSVCGISDCNRMNKHAERRREFSSRAMRVQLASALEHLDHGWAHHRLQNHHELLQSHEHEKREERRSTHVEIEGKGLIEPDS